MQGSGPRRRHRPPRRPNPASAPGTGWERGVLPGSGPRGPHGGQDGAPIATVCCPQRATPPPRGEPRVPSIPPAELAAGESGDAAARGPARTHLRRLRALRAVAELRPRRVPGRGTRSGSPGSTPRSTPHAPPPPPVPPGAHGTRAEPSSGRQVPVCGSGGGTGRPYPQRRPRAPPARRLRGADSTPAAGPAPRPCRGRGEKSLLVPASRGAWRARGGSRKTPPPRPFSKTLS